MPIAQELSLTPEELDADAEAAEPGMEEVRRQMGTKYAGGHGESAEPRKNESSARGRHWRWVVFTHSKTITWDNHKIKRG